jgi:guanine nucleotide-binding protein subunit alpha
MKSHRHVWIPYFDQVTSIVFIASLSSYDQVMVEDTSTNRLKDAIQEFQKILSSKLLRNQLIILFLNKSDLFKAKISKSPLNKYFADYEGTKGSVTLGVNYIRKLFLADIPKDRQDSIKCHVTCCTDSKQMKKIIADIVTFIANENLKSLDMD